MGKLKPLSLFVFVFALACERILIRTHSTGSKRVVRPDNILFVGTSMQLSDRTFYKLGAVKRLKLIELIYRHVAAPQCCVIERMEPHPGTQTNSSLVTTTACFHHTRSTTKLKSIKVIATSESVGRCCARGAWVGTSD